MTGFKIYVVKGYFDCSFDTRSLKQGNPFSRAATGRRPAATELMTVWGKLVGGLTVADTWTCELPGGLETEELLQVSFQHPLLVGRGMTASGKHLPVPKAPSPFDLLKRHPVMLLGRWLEVCCDDFKFSDSRNFN